MSTARVSNATVNTDTGEYDHKWSFTAMMLPEDAMEELIEAHPEWTSIVLTILKVRV